MHIPRPKIHARKRLAVLGRSTHRWLWLLTIIVLTTYLLDVVPMFSRHSKWGIRLWALAGAALALLAYTLIRHQLFPYLRIWTVWRLPLTYIRREPQDKALAYAVWGMGVAIASAILLGLLGLGFMLTFALTL